jgi:hypothetical protein
MDDGNDFMAYLIIAVMLLIAGIVLLYWVIKASLGAWWVDLGALIAALLGPIVYENYSLVTELTSLPPNKIIDAVLHDDIIEFPIKPKVLNTYLNYCKWFSIGLSVIVFIFGWIILASKHGTEPRFRYYQMAIIGLGLFLAAAYFVTKWRIWKYTEPRFREIINTHNSAGGRVQLDLHKADSAVKRINDVAKVLHVTPAHDYRAELNTVINRSLRELIETRGKIGKQFKREYNELVAEADDYADHMETALDGIEQVRSLFQQVVTEVRHTRITELRQELLELHDPDIHEPLFIELAQDMRWDELAGFTESILVSLKEFQANLPKQRQRTSSGQHQQSQNSGSSSNTTNSDGLTSAYKRLGVKPGVKAKGLTKAYHKKSLETHPDRGGNEEDFKKVDEAYNLLKTHLKL